MRLQSLYWKAGLSLLFVPVLGSWFASEFRELIYGWCGWKTPDGYPLATTVPLGILLLVAVVLAAFTTRDLFRPRNIALGRRRSPEPHAHLILFLSKLPTNSWKFVDGVPEWLTLTGRLDDDFKELLRLKCAEKPPPPWQWEMPLRGLYHHRAVLQSVTLVCSKESLEQAPWFVRLLTDRFQREFPRLTPDGIRLLAHGGRRVPLPAPPAAAPGTHWDFENYEELYLGLTQLMDAQVRERVPEAEVMIDVTGGQKPNSIVGALLTVNRGTKFQYVQTNTPYEVVVYDLFT